MLLEILQTFNYEPQLAMPFPLIAVALGQLAVGAYGLHKANKAKIESNTLKQQLEGLEKSRQEVFDASDDIRALKSQISNPYANLSVATQAAEMQAEQTDQALANTLDTLQTGGFGGGGATALAQAAARSKQGISASIEQQEVNNEKLRVQGQASVESQRMGLEQAAIGAEGQAWQIQEQRDITQLDRKQAEIDQALGQQAQFQADAMGSFTGALGSFAMAATPPTPIAGANLNNLGYTGPNGGAPYGPGSQNSPQSQQWSVIANGITDRSTMITPVQIGVNLNGQAVFEDRG
tara:strand:+ start:535 stop:1413 length:879 start_codon:yes stop_codon:yes gene_type:complete